MVAALALLGVKVLASILIEYRWYFPANFAEAAFLIGRERTFTPAYAAAFYVHILTGPPTIVLATFLMWSGGRKRWLSWHRWSARVLMALIFVALVPSGVLMARRAFAGPLAGIAFGLLSLLTALTAAMTLYFARQREVGRHQRWATRCFVLLVSPLILRVVSGVFIVTQTESPSAYILNAWLSWLLPLVIYEIGWRTRAITLRGAVAPAASLR